MCVCCNWHSIPLEPRLTNSNDTNYERISCLGGLDTQDINYPVNCFWLRFTVEVWSYTTITLAQFGIRNWCYLNYDRNGFKIVILSGSRSWTILDNKNADLCTPWLKFSPDLAFILCWLLEDLRAIS